MSFGIFVEGHSHNESPPTGKPKPNYKSKRQAGRLDPERRLTQPKLLPSKRAAVVMTNEQASKRVYFDMKLSRSSSVVELD